MAVSKYVLCSMLGLSLVSCSSSFPVQPQSQTQPVHSAHTHSSASSPKPISTDHTSAHMAQSHSSTPPTMTSKVKTEVKCVPVDRSTLATIEAGGQPQVLEISAASAYKPAGKHPYFVAARFTDPSGTAQVGVWALSSLKIEGAPRILSVNQVAQDSTFWQKANISELHLGSSDPGVAKSTACLGT